MNQETKDIVVCEHCGMETARKERCEHCGEPLVIVKNEDAWFFCGKKDTKQRDEK